MVQRARRIQDGRSRASARLHLAAQGRAEPGSPVSPQAPKAAAPGRVKVKIDASVRALDQIDHIVVLMHGEPCRSTRCSATSAADGDDQADGLLPDDDLRARPTGRTVYHDHDNRFRNTSRASASPFTSC